MITRRTLLGAGATSLGLTALSPAVTGSARAHGSWDRLRRYLRGDLVLPSDAGYTTAKELYNMRWDAVHPQAVAYCESRFDVALCLKFAQDRGLPFTARSGGHSLGGYSTTPGLIIDVSRLKSIDIGDGGRRMRVGPGVQSIDALGALSPHGLVMASGSCPTVAVGGFVTGGGIGLMTRQMGVASDRMTSARVVLANGCTVTASARRHSDLFWALRGGGGGNFGIVTEYTLVPEPITTVVSADLNYGYDSALDMLDGYARWLVDAPRTITGLAYVALPDAAPGVTPFGHVLVVSTGTEAELEREVGRLISLTGAPAARTGGVVSYQELLMGLYGCGDLSVEQCHQVGVTPTGQLQRTPYIRERSRLFSRPMPREGWAAALAAFETERVGGQFHQLSILPLAGAANDPDRDDTAYVHRDSLYLSSYLAVIPHTPVTDEATATVDRWVDRGFATFNGHSNGETHQNFIDPLLPDSNLAYYAENHERLVRVKRRYDPYGAFTFPQSVS